MLILKELLGFPRSKALNHTSSILRATLHVDRFFLPLAYRNPSAIIGLVRIYALTAGALSRFFFFRAQARPKEKIVPAVTAPGQRELGKSASLAHELCLLLTPFRINTCKSVSKQSTLTIFRINTYRKRGEGGVMVNQQLLGALGLLEFLGGGFYRLH
jgi:hypothetical protein